ncbi:hypothetical protein C4E44_16810 [Pseudomonas sp. MWU12-2312b]|nr:hypothetical protein C4E44_16810 [Pseudomonas sp. MWU12-2312b]
MTLLSGLLHHLKSTAISERAVRTAPPAPTSALTLLRSIDRGPATPPHLNAATATPEWRQTRDQYLNHIMVCPACYAPTSRYCLAGADLRASYDRTHIEPLK